MAEVRSIEEMVLFMRDAQKRLSTGIASLNDAKNHRDLMIREGRVFSAISTQINSMLAESEDVLDMLATEIAAVSYVYRELVYPRPEMNFDSVVVDYDNTYGFGHIRAKSDAVYVPTSDWSKPVALLRINYTKHGLADDTYVIVSDTDEAGANAIWKIDNASADYFELDGSAAVTTPGAGEEGLFSIQPTPYSVFSVGDIVKISGASDPDNSCVREVQALVSAGAGLTFTTGLSAADTSDNTGLMVELIER